MRALQLAQIHDVLFVVAIAERECVAAVAAAAVTVIPTRQTCSAQGTSLSGLAQNCDGFGRVWRRRTSFPRGT